jgi:hypothetical protein
MHMLVRFVDKIKIKDKVKMFHINMLKSYVEREDGVVVSDTESNSGDRRGRCAMISIVDEEIMKNEDGHHSIRYWIRFHLDWIITCYFGLIF